MCFLSKDELNNHVKDDAFHLEFDTKKQELTRQFAPVVNALNGDVGRKLIARRLLYSVDLYGLENRLKV